MQGLLLYPGIALFLKFRVHQVATPGFGLGRDRKTVFLEFPVFNQRAVIRRVVFILVSVLSLLCGFGFVDFKSPAQIQLVQIFVFYTGVARF